MTSFYSRVSRNTAVRRRARLTGETVRAMPLGSRCSAAVATSAMSRWGCPLAPADADFSEARYCSMLSSESMSTASGGLPGGAASISEDHASISTPPCHVIRTIMSFSHTVTRYTMASLVKLRQCMYVLVTSVHQNIKRRGAHKRLNPSYQV